LTWPDFYPADCPPEDSQPTVGIFYRFTRTKEATSEDFKSFRELDFNKKYDLPEWQVCGLSVFMDQSTAIQVGARVPALRKKYPACRALTEENGVYRPTPSETNPEHLTWWYPTEFEPWVTFEHDPDADKQIRKKIEEMRQEAEAKKKAQEARRNGEV